MYLPPDEDKKRKFFKTLSTNKVAYEGFLDFLRDEVEAQKRVLENLAVAALVDDKHCAQGRVQLGRVQMIETLLLYAEQFPNLKEQ